MGIGGGDVRWVIIVEDVVFFFVVRKMVMGPAISRVEGAIVIVDEGDIVGVV